MGRECPPEAPVAPILGRKKRETSEDGGCPAGWLTPFAEAVGLQGVPTHSEAQEAAHSPLTGAGVAGRMGRALHFNLVGSSGKEEGGCQSPGPAQPHHLTMSLALGPWDRQWALAPWPPPSPHPLPPCP